MESWTVDTDFNCPLSQAQVCAIADSEDNIYVLDPALTIRAYNHAYVNFGVANGCSVIVRDFGIGCSLEQVLNGAARDFYIPAYRRAMERNQRLDHDYECSSPLVFRRFHQSAYPLADGKALVVSHHLMHEYPHVWHPRQLRPKHFDEHGWLTQCACCRKVRDGSARDKWDWIPRIVQSPHPRAIQTYCGNCLSFYYGNTVEWWPARPQRPVRVDGSSSSPDAVPAPPSVSSVVNGKWLIFRNLFGGWCWEHLDRSGSLVGESQGDFPTRELCEADAAKHGWLGDETAPASGRLDS
jgi:hypothetical protein